MSALFRRVIAWCRDPQWCEVHDAPRFHGECKR